MIERPALAAVLAALTNADAEVVFALLREPNGVLRLDADAAQFGGERCRIGTPRLPWVTTDAAEAWEMLVTAGLLDETERRTFDVGAAAIGNATLSVSYAGALSLSPAPGNGFEFIARSDPDAARVDPPIDLVLRRGAVARKATISRRAFERERPAEVVARELRALVRQWPHPATIADLVAVASLGPLLYGAEELCHRIAPELAALGYAVDPCERVVWRVSNEARRVRGGVVGQWPTRGGDALLTADGTLDAPNGYASMRRDEVPALRALWEMGFTLAEDVGAECVLCVPPIGATFARLGDSILSLPKAKGAPLRVGDRLSVGSEGRVIPAVGSAMTIGYAVRDAAADDETVDVRGPF